MSTEGIEWTPDDPPGEHHPQCEGHVTCPDCGDHCAKVVLWQEPLYRPVTVLCLGCHQTRAVNSLEVKETNMAITPTVGRIVWYRPKASDELARNGNEPLAAVICCVWSNTCINIAGFDANGQPFARTSVLLLQPGDELESTEGHPGNGYAEWMPYQRGQAQKAEALEAELKAQRAP